MAGPFSRGGEKTCELYGIFLILGSFCWDCFMGVEDSVQKIAPGRFGIGTIRTIGMRIVSWDYITSNIGILNNGMSWNTITTEVGILNRWKVHMFKKTKSTFSVGIRPLVDNP